MAFRLPQSLYHGYAATPNPGNHLPFVRKKGILYKSEPSIPYRTYPYPYCPLPLVQPVSIALSANCIRFCLFLPGGLLALIIASLTIGSHAIKAPRTNPVDALRNE